MVYLRKYEDFNMSRYRGSRNKIIKRLFDLDSAKGRRRSFSLPGFKNTIITPKVKNSPGNRSQQAGGKQTAQQQLYKLRLIEKQKLKYYYGLTERQLVNYFLKAKQAEGSTADRLLQSLEMRLDNIVFRLGLAPSIPSARQLVTHGHIQVNTKKIHAPGYNCKSGDRIFASRLLHTGVSQQTRPVVEQAFYLMPLDNGGKVLGESRNCFLPYNINTLRVIEYYSK